MNNPNYIYLLINPEKKVFAIQRCARKRRDAVKIEYSDNKDCEIYSIGLVDQMTSLETATCVSNTIKLYGRTYGNNGIIEFDIF